MSFCKEDQNALGCDFERFFLLLCKKKVADPGVFQSGKLCKQKVKI